MKYIFIKSLIFVLVFLLPYFLYAQSAGPVKYDLRFGNSVVKQNTEPAMFCTDIQIRAAEADETFAIGSHTVWFNYNNHCIINPVYTGLNFTPETECDVNGSLKYNPYLKTSFSFYEFENEGNANFTTLLDNFFDNYECPIVTDTWFKMGQVCFEIADATQNTNLYFDETLTVLNLSDDTPEHNQNVLNTLDLTLSDLILNIGENKQPLSSLKVYPNPVNNIIQLDLIKYKSYYVKNPVVLNFSIFSIDGRLIEIHQLSLLNNEYNYSLAVDNLVSGLYLYSLEIDGRYQFGKFVVE